MSLRNSPFAPAAATIDSVFIALMHGFRPYGGMAREGEIRHKIGAARRHTGDSAGGLDEREGRLCIEWSGIRWWPLFQFDAAMALRPESAQVMRELAPIYDAWDLALWLVTPNRWLYGRPPVEKLFTDTDGILAAARADRFALEG